MLRENRPKNIRANMANFLHSKSPNNVAKGGVSGSGAEGGKGRKVNDAKSDLGLEGLNYYDDYYKQNEHLKSNSVSSLSPKSNNTGYQSGGGNFNIHLINKHDYDSGLENENQKLKKETKELIAKTKKIMESMDAHKMGGDSTNISRISKHKDDSNIRTSRTPGASGASPITPGNVAGELRGQPIQERSKSNSLELRNNSYDNMKLTNDDVFLKNHLTMKYNTINKKFVEKLKVIKNLERELKSKNSYISTLTRKLDKQKEENLQLNEKLNSEKNLNLRYENSGLQRKITDMEKEHIAKCNKYEKILSEYKIKVENLIKINDGLIMQSKELTGKNQKSVESNLSLEDQIKKLQTEKYNLEDDLNVMRGKYEYEAREVKKQEEKNKEFNHKVKQLLSYLRTYYLEFKEHKVQNRNQIEKLYFLFGTGNPNFGNSASSNLRAPLAYTSNYQEIYDNNEDKEYKDYKDYNDYNYHDSNNNMSHLHSYKEYIDKKYETGELKNSRGKLNDETFNKGATI